MRLILKDPEPVVCIDMIFHWMMLDHETKREKREVASKDVHACTRRIKASRRGCCCRPTVLAPPEQRQHYTQKMAF